MKRITVAVCVDDRLGVMFNKRRQSRDGLLIKELCDSTGCSIYITEYSLPLFSDFKDRVIVCKDPIAECEVGCISFVEGLPLREHMDEIERLIIYRWNRRYPSDVKLDIDIEKDGYKLESETEFVGSSHEKITKGIYVK